MIHRLSKVRNPKDISLDHIELLNLHLMPDATFAELMPYYQGDGQTSFPQIIPTNSDRFEKVIEELRTENGAAYREVLRLPVPKFGHRAKLGHARRFWTGLEQMSQYWDTSLDEYYEVPDLKTQPASTVPGTDVRLPPPKNGDTEMEDACKSTQTMKRVYKGRRIGTGRDMPEEYRDEMLKGLMEAIAWAFNCQVTTPSQQPKVAIGKVLIPVKQTWVVGRGPRDRLEAKKGMLEGPVMGVFSRGQTGYGAEAHKDLMQAEVCDLLREVGTMIGLAQERAREGKVEKKGGDGMWYTSVHRWGGGPGGPMGWEDETQESTVKGKAKKHSGAGAAAHRKRPLSHADLAKMMEELDEADLVPSHIRRKAEEGTKEKEKEREKGKDGSPRPISGSRNKSGTGAGAKKWTAMGEKWKTIKPGPSGWDPRMKYMRIGRSRGDGPDGNVDGKNGFDDVFMVSSINHHARVLRLRVSDEYLTWLAGGEKGEEPDISRQDSLGQGLALWRTRWFNLFEPEERVALFEGLWTIMTWLLREGDVSRQ